MNQELCFILNGIPIYLDKILVKFNEIPIFFICRDKENKHYLVMLNSYDVLEYHIVMVSDKDLYKMLSGSSTMRETMELPEWYWVVYSKDTPENDSVWYIGGKTINKCILPELGAIYTPVTEEDKEYIQNFKEEFLK